MVGNRRASWQLGALFVTLQLMSKSPNKLTAILLLGVFTFFYCGNALFVHTHDVGDSKIVHSHPYLPSGQHSHSSQNLISIFGFNSALSTVTLSEAMEFNAPLQYETVLEAVSVETETELHATLRQWRAPPMWI